jgi:tetratricopeptide (TPR) repeat protein
MRRCHWIALLVLLPALVFAQANNSNQANPALQGPATPQFAALGGTPAESSSSAGGAQNPEEHSYANDPRFTVSVSSLAAPEKAKKAFRKGEEEARKGRWQFASDYFKKAIEVYPRYALAWLELGRVRAKQSSFADAQHCFRQAVTEDSKLLDGYMGLAYVDLQQQDWKDLADSTNHLVELAPDSSAQYWFLNAAAYYNLADMQRAETSVTHGLRIDQRHEVPQMEYLYGLILGNKKEYGDAVQHIVAYLHLAPNATDKEAALDVLGSYRRAQMAESQQQ